MKLSDFTLIIDKLISPDKDKHSSLFSWIKMTKKKVSLPQDYRGLYHKRFVKHFFYCSKLVCLSKLVRSWQTVLKILAYYEISVIYDSLMFYRTDSSNYKNFTAVVKPFHNKLERLYQASISSLV